jgi:hypothetical protein
MQNRKLFPKRVLLNFVTFLAKGSYVTKVNDSGLELIAQKWSHSLIDVDFSWSVVTKSLDAAVSSLAEQGECSQLK